MKYSEKDLKAAYLAGFNASGEGWNGEYPFSDKGISPDQDNDWLKRRDEYIANVCKKNKGGRK